MIITRIAPTPSGYLHLGNAVNFLLTWLTARSQDGLLYLRIDDADSTRTRPEFIDDIFQQLDWLGITWDRGPSGPADFQRNHSQLLRIDRYREILHQLQQAHHLYPCVCSRKTIRANSPNGIYPGTCRAATAKGNTGYAIRVLVPESTLLTIDEVTIRLDRDFGDFVLWRRDGLPAYQLVSVVDDIDHQVNCIVRGVDLRPSTAAQIFLAQHLATGSFAACRFLHHPLLTDSAGKKLAKSRGALTLQALRENGAAPRMVYQLAARMLALPPAIGQTIATLDELLAAVKEGDHCGPAAAGWCMVGNGADVAPRPANQSSTGPTCDRPPLSAQPHLRHPVPPYSEPVDAIDLVASPGEGGQKVHMGSAGKH